MKKINRNRLILALSVLWLSYPCAGSTHHAASLAEVTDICKRVQPGDEIILADGVYTDRHFIFTGKGTKEKPITLRAETAGKVVFNGTSKLSIGGEHLVVDGLLFRDGALESGSIIEFRAKNTQPTRHCILRNTAIIDYNPPKIDTRYFWVSLYGTDNTVEYCRVLSLFWADAFWGHRVCLARWKKISQSPDPAQLLC